VLFGRAVRDAFDQRFDAFDFGGDASGWKEAYTSHSEPHAKICVSTRGNLRCSCFYGYHTWVKPLLSRHLPALLELRERYRARRRTT